MTEIDRLDVDTIEAGLETKLVGSKILVYQSTPSSNDVAWEYANNEENNGLAVFTEQQNAGRGRMGTQWLSEPGDSILCSILLVDCSSSAELLTLTAAVAAAEAVYNCSNLPARIKWPNDIILNNKKTAGILVESRSNNSGTDYVIGIGINCHQQKKFFTQNQLQKPATSIDLQAGKTIQRNLLAKELLTSVDKWLTKAQANNLHVVEQWKQLSSQLGHRVTLEYNQHQFTGNCVGVDPTEGLILQLEKGGVRMFDAAHTRIIK